MSQSKPPASGRVTVLAEDLRLVIKSNEEGKKAKAQMLEYASRVNILQSNIVLLNQRILVRDSIMANQDKSIDNLFAVSQNKDIMLRIKDDEIKAGLEALNQAKKEKRQAKRKTFFMGLIGALATSAAIFLKF